MLRRYPQVAQQLATDIANGVYPVGSTLPNEPALAESFGVSRSTIRAALTELQGLGLVSRRRSLGTKVEMSRPAGATGGFKQTLETIDAIAQYAAATRRQKIETEDVVLDTDLAAILDLPPGSRWLRVSYLRADPEKHGEPICWTDVYIKAAYSQIVRERVRDHRGALVDLIEEDAGRRVVEVRQTIRAAGISEQLAEPLNATSGQHALEIVRRYGFSGGETVEVSVSVHPGDRFEYVTTLLRGA